MTFLIIKVTPRDGAGVLAQLLCFLGTVALSIGAWWGIGYVILWFLTWAIPQLKTACLQ